jgi:hypothetical protein
MSRRRIALLTVLAVVVAGGGFGLGRLTAPPPARAKAPADQGYAAGFQAGRAEGVQEGRGLQQAAGTTGDPFADGYKAGASDAFGGYDGGWSLGVPYVITLQSGTGGAAYRITDRTELQPGVNYFLCADGKSLCQEKR